MSGRRYTEDHEWVHVEGDIATIGISDHAQKQLGDVVYVALPDIDAEVTKGAETGTVESVKAASEIYAPLSGRITAVNTTLENDPALVNRSPEGEGWFYKMALSTPGELSALMDEASYAVFTAEA